MFALFPEFGARTRFQDLWPFLISETGLKFLIWTQGKIHPGNRASRSTGLIWRGANLRRWEKIISDCEAPWRFLWRWHYFLLLLWIVIARLLDTNLASRKSFEGKKYVIFLFVTLTCKIFMGKTFKHFLCYERLPATWTTILIHAKSHTRERPLRAWR